MRLLRRHKHPGVLFRISTPSGVVTEMDSQHLYYVARFSDADDWLNLITGTDPNFGPPCPAEEFSTVPLKIEIKPVRLRELD